MKTRNLLPLFMASFLAVGCSARATRVYDVSEYSKKSDENKTSFVYKDGYKIMQLSDLHFSCYDYLEEDFNYLKFLMKEAQPNLVVITGDCFTFASKTVVRRVYDFFNNTVKEIESQPYWVVTMGNHDEQIYGAYNYTSIYASSLDRCLLNYHEDDALTGISNTIVNLYDPLDMNKVKYQIFVIDSNSYTYNPIGYDYVHQDQIDWYKTAIERANQPYGWTPTSGTNAPVKSIIFEHIPVPEFNNAYKDYESDPTKGTGDNRENPSASNYNSNFYQTIKEYRSTTAMIVGHDHVNNSDIVYDGNFRFIYGAKSTDNMYYDGDRLGYRLVTLDSSDSFGFKTSEVYHVYADALEVAA